MSANACYQQLAIRVHFSDVTSGRNSKICGFLGAPELRGCRGAGYTRVCGIVHPFACAARSGRLLDAFRTTPSHFHDHGGS